MKKTLAVLGGCGFYIMAIKLIAPTREPIFLLGIPLIGLTTWMLGMLPALLLAVLLVPVTQYFYSDISTTIRYLTIAASPSYIAVQLFTILAFGVFHKKSREMRQEKEDLEAANQHLQDALLHVKELGGLLSICSNCKKIRDDSGFWMALESYLSGSTKAEFSHGICPDCAKKLYGGFLGDDYDYSSLDTEAQSPKNNEIGNQEHP